MFLTLSAAIFSLKGTSGSLVFISILLLGCNNVIARNKTFVFYLSTLVEDALLCLLWMFALELEAHASFSEDAGSGGFLFPKEKPVNDMQHRAPGAHGSAGILSCRNPEWTRTQDEASLLITF